MKLILCALVITLSGCATMDPHQARNFSDGFMGALSIGAQQEQFRNNQLMMQPRRSTSCTTRYNGANAYTDCW